MTAFCGAARSAPGCDDVDSRGRLRARPLRAGRPHLPTPPAMTATPRHRFRPRQRVAGARHGRRRGGEIRPPRDADGDGRDRRRAVAPPPVARSRASALGRSRPLRAVQRPRLDAAVRAAAPHRLRPVARRAQALPPAALEDAGAPGDRHHARRRDDDRAARPGHRQRRGHGPRRSAARGAVQPAGSHHRRPPHLGVPRRRLPDGGRVARGLRAGRHARAVKLVAFWDDNGISIDGEVGGWFTDDTPARFEAYGWNVVRAVDGHDVDAVDAAIRRRSPKRRGRR